jgi:DNA-binding NarL/FixJ family response regulator
VAKLTNRQCQVAALVGLGETNKEIARILGISPNTVKEYISTILRDRQLKNRAALAATINDPAFLAAPRSGLPAA